jgi:hypothetical protein
MFLRRQHGVPRMNIGSHRRRPPATSDTLCM